MKLKLKPFINRLDDVPEFQSALYEPTADGKFKLLLEIEGMEDAAALKSALEKV